MKEGREIRLLEQRNIGPAEAERRSRSPNDLGLQHRAPRLEKVGDLRTGAKFTPDGLVSRRKHCSSASAGGVLGAGSLGPW